MKNDGVNVFRRIEWAVNAALASTTNRRARSQIEDMYWHSAGYAEPGYDEPESGAIVLGNWNDITEFDEETRTFNTLDDTPSRLARIFEILGADIGWSDCWSDCHECGALVRTDPDSYGWRPHYHIDEGSLVCFDCLDAEEYLEGLEENKHAINQMFEPGEHGYVLVADRFERGMHYGQDAHPGLIAELMNEAGIKRWLFNLDSKGQFDIDFSLWIHKDEADRNDGEILILAKRVIEQGNTDGASVAGAMERGLREASRQSDELRKAGATGLLVSKVGMDSTTTKEVSDKDFIDGKALD